MDNLSAKIVLSDDASQKLSAVEDSLKILTKMPVSLYAVWDRDFVFQRVITEPASTFFRKCQPGKGLNHINAFGYEEAETGEHVVKLGYLDDYLAVRDIAGYAIEVAGFGHVEPCEYRLDMKSGSGQVVIQTAPELK